MSARRASASPARHQPKSAVTAGPRRDGGNRDARAREAGGERARQLRRAGRVAVNAEGVDAQRDLGAVHRRDPLVFDHPHRAPHDRVHVVDDGSGPGPRRQRAVRLVRAIRESFRRDREPRGLPRANQLRRRQPEEDERRIERADGARDRVGERAIPRRHVVERAVRLDVPQPHPFAVRDRRQRADLIEDQVLGVLRGDADLAPAEPGQIRKPGMRADRHPRVARQPHGPPHHRRIPAVKPARDVRRRDAGHHLGVGADAVRAERLAHIAIQINRAHVDHQ